MKYKITTSLLLLAILTVCSQATETGQTSKIDFNLHIGWLHGACLAINNPNLKNTTQIDVIILEQPQVHIRSQILAKVTPDNHCPALLEDRKKINISNMQAFYRVELDKKYKDTMAIGMINLSSHVDSKKNAIQIDINNNHINEVASTCTTSEGIQFLIQESNNKKDNIIWSSYYYLGYDLTPTCPD